MEFAEPHMPERGPFDRRSERRLWGSWNLEETRMMHRSLETMRGIAVSLDDPDLKEGIEMHASNLYTSLVEEVHADPERAVDMVNELMVSDDVADRDLACDLLVIYQYDLLDRDALEDPVAEAARWRQLIDNEPLEEARQWFREAPTGMIEIIQRAGRHDLQPFVDALHEVIGEDQTD